MKTINQKICAATLLIFFCVPLHASAANIFFESASKSLLLNTDLLVNVYMDTEGVSVNAVEGRISFPDIFGAEISDGNSAINFWIEKPKIKSPGVIEFSGINTGGISQPRALLFSIILHAKNPGAGRIEASSIVLLKNDGAGTEVGSRSSPIDLSVSAQSGEANLDAFAGDKRVPEHFVPLIAQSQDIFSGKNFLVFATQDKESGVDHYEVKEGVFGKYVSAESPYLLLDQSLQSTIYVKAIDKNGNERVVKMWPQNKLPLYIVIGIFVIIIAIALSRKRLWPKHKK